MRQFRSSAFAIIFGLLVGLMAGCSQGVPMAGVSGTVTMNKKPLNKVRIEFWPEKDGPKSSGVTDELGHYTLKTEDGKTPGAVVGSHRVILKDLLHYGDKFLGRKAEDMPVLNKDAKQRFAKSYENPNETPLKKSVSAGEPNTIDLELQ
jgi:hypothetical protein